MNRCFFQQTLVLIFIALLFSCSSTNNKPLLIDFSTDSLTIVFHHIDRAGLNRLKGSGVNDSTFRNLVSISEMPNELDSTFQERVIAGRFQLTDSVLIFTPDLPFVKGREYLVITHLNSKFGDIKALLKGESGVGLRPLQKELVR